MNNIPKQANKNIYNDLVIIIDCECFFENFFVNVVVDNVVDVDDCDCDDG